LVGCVGFQLVSYDFLSVVVESLSVNRCYSAA
jgi:hypothetical protein